MATKAKKRTMARKHVPAWAGKLRTIKASEVCKGSMYGPDGTRCVVGHLMEQGAVATTSAHEPARLSFRDFVGGPVMGFNDNPANSKTKIAATYNRWVRRVQRGIV
jgi:hypothetical protein